MVPPFPHAPTSVYNFFTLDLTKKIIESKRCRIEFQIRLYTCIISVFMKNKRAIYEFFIFQFSIVFIFKYSDIDLLWSKINIFIIAIFLKLCLHTKYWMK